MAVTTDWDFDEELGGTFAEDRARFGLAPLPYGPDVDDQESEDNSSKG